MCTAYQTQYTLCGCFGPLLIDDCAVFLQDGACDERAAILQSGQATKIKQINASCGIHQ